MMKTLLSHLHEEKEELRYGFIKDRQNQSLIILLSYVDCAVYFCSVLIKKVSSLKTNCDYEYMKFSSGAYH